VILPNEMNQYLPDWRPSKSRFVRLLLATESRHLSVIVMKKFITPSFARSPTSGEAQISMKGWSQLLVRIQLLYICSRSLEPPCANTVQQELLSGLRNSMMLRVKLNHPWPELRCLNSGNCTHIYLSSRRSNRFVRSLKVLQYLLESMDFPKSARPRRA